MLKLRMDGGHARLTDQDSLEACTDLGCLSLTNLMVWSVEGVFSTATEIPTMHGLTGLSQWPQVFLKAPIDHLEAFRKVYIRSLH